MTIKPFGHSRLDLESICDHRVLGFEMDRPIKTGNDEGVVGKSFSLDPAQTHTLINPYK